MAALPPLRPVERQPLLPIQDIEDDLGPAAALRQHLGPDYIVRVQQALVRLQAEHVRAHGPRNTQKIN